MSKSSRNWIIFCLAMAGLAFFWMMNGPSSAVEIIAHRGASHDAPENTLASMKLAWEQNTDAIELDLHLTKDGRIAVYHDFSTERFGGPRTRVAEQTWEELQRLDLGGWKAPQFKGERMPTLESILQTIPKGRRAVLEIKCGPEILPELERVLNAAGRKNSELAIISFQFETLRQSKQKFSGIPHYFLCGYERNPQTGQYPMLADLLNIAQAGCFDGLDLHYAWPIDRAFVDRVKAAGLYFVVWTVDDPVVAAQLVEAGVHGLTSNRPGWLKEELAKQPQVTGK